jgi:hypothetical protein
MKYKVVIEFISKREFIIEADDKESAECLRGEILEENETDLYANEVVYSHEIPEDKERE